MLFVLKTTNIANINVPILTCSTEQLRYDEYKICKYHTHKRTLLTMYLKKRNEIQVGGVRLAQWIERVTSNHKVMGSIPILDTLLL